MRIHCYLCLSSPLFALSCCYSNLREKTSRWRATMRSRSSLSLIPPGTTRISWRLWRGILYRPIQMLGGKCHIRTQCGSIASFPCLVKFAFLQGLGTRLGEQERIRTIWAARVRACNYVKFETGWNLPPVTCPAHCIGISHYALLLSTYVDQVFYFSMVQ